MRLRPVIIALQESYQRHTSNVEHDQDDDGIRRMPGRSVTDLVRFR
ncbi:hypothetical protein ABIA06_004745 [Bradyrhizobium yuanmingense]|uniref:Uncharacterized protein n=1 Tax=Bradyrhizobium yuanmingense TaxID=108015 RepID=A0A1C3UMC0_9BRAD|nr:hypothetical protein IQ15_00631 [Bradyrhizobium yuanmingense]SCB16612.1 hypothetical protein GA0061099_1002319 [Bradyrhizobium yuanmingense]